MMMKRFLYSFLLMGLLILLSGHNVWAYTMEECIECHKEGSDKAKLYIPLEVFKASIHHREETTCMDCHMDVTDEDHETTKGSGIVDCSECHDEENKHGQEATIEDRPQCHSCHPKHRMLEKSNPASAVHPDQLKNTCRECHPVESGETGYFSWLPSIRLMSHKKQDFSQAYGKDNCLGCHQGDTAHGEEDPLDKQNCYICHIGLDGQPPVMGYIHAQADAKKQPGIFVAATIYQIIIGLLLLGGIRFYIPRFSGKLRKRRK
jgi:hypothetical protein